MSFLFGKNNLPNENQRPLGVQTERMSTNEAARVLPWFLGTRWMAATWMGDVFDVRTDEVRRKTGKKEGIVGYWYYAHFVGLICGGPVDRITRIKFDDTIIWNGSIERHDENYVNITTSKGVMTLFWGTETQELDASLEASGQEHSAYRGQCYIIGRDILLGADRTTVPNLQVELGRKPKPSDLVRTASRFIRYADDNATYDVNPVSALIEWWTDKRFGCGRSESELDSNLTDVADQLIDEGIGISPLVTSASDMKTLLIKLLEHIDGYPTATDGKLGIALNRPVTDASVLTITKAHLVEDYSLQYQSWPDTADEVRVKFKDWAMDGADNSAKHHDSANYVATGRHRAQNVDRPWVTRASVAQAIAGSIGRVAGVPQASGKMKVRASVVRSYGLAVGVAFDLTTRDGVTMRMRISEITEPNAPDTSFEIGFKSDTGWANDEFYAPTADAIPDTPTLEPEQAYAIRIVDSPYALALVDNPALLFMVARGDTYATTFDVWKASLSEGPFSSASSRRGSPFSKFAVRARLTTAYSASTLPIDDLVGITFEVLSPDQTILEDERDYASGLNHELLCMFGSEVTEIMALFDLVKTGATTYTANVIRALYDTRRRTHVVGTELWIQLRTSFEADVWPPYSEDPRYYKVQPQFLAAEVDLADIAAVDHTENGRTALPICPANVLVDGDGHHPTWTVGNDIVLSWWNTSRARTVFGLPFNSAPATDLTHIDFEFWDGGTLLASLTEDAADEEATVTNAYLVANVNVTFRLRAYGVRNGNRSIDYTEVDVVKV